MISKLANINITVLRCSAGASWKSNTVCIHASLSITFNTYKIMNKSQKLKIAKRTWFTIYNIYTIATK